MGGGGKGGTTTQTVSIPPEVLARYNAVNARAEETAKQPFQQYGGEFVAPLTPTQQAGIASTNAAAGQAQPYYDAATSGLLGAQQSGSNYIGAATGAALAGAMPVNPGGLNVGQYMNPYTRNVVGATQAALGQQQGQQLAQQQAEAIRAGAFGGQRAGLQRAQLMGQQGLAQAQAIAPLYQQGYQQALQTAQQQQGVGLGAEQANRQAVQQLSQQLGGLGQQGYAMGSSASQQLAGLGTGAQQAALQGAQAQLAAGQIGQQTQQAQDTAQYQQFLQERGYPFQVAQFLANIAMGTGALSGSTTTTQQPGGFFSDKRLKHDVKEIGETHDGQPIYSYKYNGDDRTQIGLMAQDVEKKHPEAVGLMGGYKTVDYKKATEGAERSHKDMGGGLMPDGFDPSSMGGAVMPDMSGEGFMRGGYVGGGLVGNDDWAQIIAANKQALGVYGGAQPMGAGSPGATGIVPQTQMATPKLVTAGSLPQQKPSGLSTAMQTGKDIAGSYKGGKELLLGGKDSSGKESAGLIGGGGNASGKSVFGEFKDWWNTPSPAATGGLIVPRHAYAFGGGDDSQGDEAVPYDPSDVMGGKDPMEGVLKAGSQKHDMLKPAGGGGAGGGGGPGLVGGLAQGIGAAKGLFEGGSWLANTAFPFIFAKDGGRIEHAYAYGGLVPRQGYDEGGPVDTGSLFSSLEKKYELPEGYLNRTWQIESGGGKNLYNEGSKAAGHFQFIPGTQKMMGLENPYDLSESADATARLAAQNREYLRKGGIDEPTAAHLYLAHQQGPLGATRLLNAADRPAGLVVGEKAVTGNRGDPNARGLDFANQIMAKYEGTQGPASGPIPAAIPRPPRLVGDGIERTAPGGEGKKSLGDIVTSEGFVVPALGFLGSMLASNKPNLGQALGEGIMGGVGAYQSQKKLTPEIAYKEAETRKMTQETDLQLIDRLLKFNQVRVARGQPPITNLEDFKKKLADGSIIESPSQGGAAQPSAGQQQQPSGQQGAQPSANAPSVSTNTDATERTLAAPPVQQAMSQINWNNVAASHNIPQIQAEIETTKRLAETATDPATLQSLQEKQAVLRGEIQKILESKILIDRNGNPFVPPEWQRAANQIESQKTKAVKDADAYATMEEGLRHAQTAMPLVQQKFENLGNILTRYQSGPLENFKTFVPAIAQAVGMDVDPSKIATRSDFEKFVKESRDLLFQQLKQVGGRILVTEVQRMQEAVVDPHLQPAANRSLVASGKGATNYNQDFYDYYRGWKRDNPYATVDDFADMQREWQSKHKLQQYINAAEADTPVKGHLPEPKDRKDGWKYIDDTPSGKKIFPKGTIFQWDAQRGKPVVVGPVP